MTSQRPISVFQTEAGPNSGRVGDFWYVVKGANGSIILTSETYRTRARAKRAARAFIDMIGDVPVTFRYCTGPTPAAMAEARALGRKPRGRHGMTVERINYPGSTGTIVEHL